MIRAKGLLVALLAVALLALGCSGDETGSSSDNGSGDDVDGDGSGGDDSGDGGDGGGDDSDSGGGDGSDSDDGDDSGGDDGDDAPDDDDAAEILGDPDLDLDDLPEGVADAIDGIDDFVSIGDCASELLGIGFEAPEDWMCRVLDQALGGLDGFTLFTEGNQLNITVGTPSPIEPCEALLQCDAAEGIALSDQWPGTQILEAFGTVLIWGRHATVNAELIITNPSELTDEQVVFISAVLDTTTTEIG